MWLAVHDPLQIVSLQLYIMIDTSKKLTTVIEKVYRAGRVGLDTEFFWERTYYPKLGLVQMAISEKECFLIDALAIEDLSPLGDLVADPEVEKVFHDAEQDVLILRRLGKAPPQRIFDTQWAAGFCGHKACISLQDVLRAFGLADLGKTATRTDWLRRPLSEEQLAYAEDDVRHLVHLRDVLLAHARARGREEWVLEEVKRYDDPAYFEERDPNLQYKRLKGTHGLTQRGLAIAREGARWREHQAREHDRTRSHVVSDQLLIALAKHRPRTTQALKNLDGPFKGAVKKYGTQLLEIVENGLKIPLSECPVAVGRPAKKTDLKARADAALAFMREKCEESGIDPVLTASRSHVTAIIGAANLEQVKDHPLLNGWRKQFLGDAFLALIRP